VPAYLTTPEDGGVINLMDYGLSLGRRFRALKLWMVIRAYGSDGLAALIAAHIDLARRLAAMIDAEPGWELLAPVPFSTVCFRFHPDGVDDEQELRRRNEAIIEQVNADGRAFVSHTDLGGRYAIRVAIGNMATTAAHVDTAWELMRDAAG
jgi:aromatic-L-amino-acid decarboxylase